MTASSNGSADNMYLHQRHETLAQRINFLCKLTGTQPLWMSSRSNWKGAGHQPRKQAKKSAAPAVSPTMLAYFRFKLKEAVKEMVMICALIGRTPRWTDDNAVAQLVSFDNGVSKT